MTTRAAPFLAHALERLEREIAETIPRVMAGGDEEAIHDMRVAIRRCRTVLREARGVFGKRRADAVRAAFTRVHRATSELRDEEVLEETLAECVRGAPSARAWLRRRKRRRERLAARVQALLSSGALDEARAMLTDMLASEVAPERDRPLGPFARRAVAKARRGVERLRRGQGVSPRALHDLRIAYKGLRYVIEIFAQALPIDDRALLPPSVTFQKRLGVINDLAVARATVSAARLPEDARALVLAALDQKWARALARFLEDHDPLFAAERAERADQAEPAQRSGSPAPVAKGASDPAPRRRGGAPTGPHT